MIPTEAQESSPADAEPRSAQLTTLIEMGPAGEHALVQQMRLEVVSGPDAGVVHAAAGDRLVIGTHECADLRLHDPSVSRFHCELGAASGRVVVRDLESRNGTFLDGVSVLAAHVREGATLSLGNTRVRFGVAAEKVAVPFSARSGFGTMVGRSVAMRRAFALLERAAASDATVLLRGETGTGKEAAAESIHAESRRAGGPFIVVDCGAIPSELLESELFGHEKGSFTGASSARDGAFLAAHGGTLFLDEIGELDLELQPKLLRALERREVKKVGQNRYVPVDVRVVAATNRDLKEEVNARRFRADLYYRLAVLDVVLPPLRERADDLSMLAGHLLDAIGDTAREPGTEFVRSPSFLADLQRHRWPGNVRELRNYLERCVALRERAPIEGGLSPGAGASPEVDISLDLREARERWIEVFEREYLKRLLDQHRGNVSAAARAAGFDRIHFYRLLWKRGLK